MSACHNLNNTLPLQQISMRDPSPNFIDPSSPRRRLRNRGFTWARFSSSDSRVRGGTTTVSLSAQTCAINNAVSLSLSSPCARWACSLCFGFLQSRAQCPMLPHLRHLSRLGWRCEAYHPCHDVRYRRAFLARLALEPPMEAATTSRRGSFPLLPLPRLRCPLLREQDLPVSGHQCWHCAMVFCCL